MTDITINEIQEDIHTMVVALCGEQNTLTYIDTWFSVAEELRQNLISEGDIATAEKVQRIIETRRFLEQRFG